MTGFWKRPNCTTLRHRCRRSSALGLLSQEASDRNNPTARITRPGHFVAVQDRRLARLAVFDSRGQGRFPSYGSDIEHQFDSGGYTVTENIKPPSISRRTVVGAALAAGAVNLAPPFIRSARAADTVKIGLNNPLTGTYAALGGNELIGAQLAVEQMNAKGGILGRPVELLSEDSTSGDAGTAVQKTRKLIERD